MLVEPGDILSAIFLTHAEEKKTFISVVVGLSLFLSVSPGQCQIPYLFGSLLSLSLSLALLCSSFSTIALFLSACLLLCLIRPRSD